MKAWLKKIFIRPRLSDLPLDERRRAKAMMLGAGAGVAKGGGFSVESEKVDEKDSVDQL